MEFFDGKTEQRIIQESVPGKQVTLAHVIASPVKQVYECLGIEETGAIGILTLTPFETSMIAADIAAKAANVDIGFLDRFTGSVVITGDVQSVKMSLEVVTERLKTLLDFDVVVVTQS